MDPIDKFHIRRFFRKQQIIAKRSSKHNDTAEEIEKLRIKQVKKRSRLIRFRKMTIKKRINKSVLCLLLASFLFVKLFIEVASLLTLRRRREGVA